MTEILFSRKCFFHPNGKRGRCPKCNACWDCIWAMLAAGGGFWAAPDVRESYRMAKRAFRHCVRVCKTIGKGWEKVNVN